MTWRLSTFRAISDLSKLEQIFWVNEGSEADFEMLFSCFNKYLSCFGCLKDGQYEAQCQAQYNYISIGFLSLLMRLSKKYRWASKVPCRCQTLVSVTQVSEDTCTSNSYFLQSVGRFSSVWMRFIWRINILIMRRGATFDCSSFLTGHIMGCCTCCVAVNSFSLQKAVP